MKNRWNSDFELTSFDSLTLERIDYLEWRSYSPGLIATNALAKARGAYVEVFDLKDKRSGPAVSVRVTQQESEVGDDSDYEEVFQKSINLFRKAIAGADIGVLQVAIALDLEGTLISNGMSQFPRPGLRSFLDGLGSLEVEVVIYSTLSWSVIDKVLANLSSDGVVPDWFSHCRRVTWRGICKSIHDVAIPGDNSVVMLVDDYEGYVCPGEEDYWIEVPTFSSPYVESSKVLQGVLEKIEAVLSGLRGV